MNISFITSNLDSLLKNNLSITTGLGDTNYDKFCHMGTAIDKRLGELGGERKLALACADEATNMEEVVEEWKTTVTKVVEDIIAAKNKNHIKAEDLQDGSETEVTQTPPGQIAEAKLIGKEEKCLVPIDGIEKTAFRDELPLYPTSMPKEVMTLAEVADAVGYTELITTPIDPSKLPRCKAFCCDRDAMYRIAIDGDTDVINHSSERSNLGSNESKGINSNEVSLKAQINSYEVFTAFDRPPKHITHITSISFALSIYHPTPHPPTPLCLTAVRRYCRIHFRQPPHRPRPRCKMADTPVVPQQQPHSSS